MIRHGHRIDLVNERFEAGEILSIEWIGRPDGERHAVQGHGIAGAHLLEDPAGPPAGIHEVLRDGLEPVHPRPLPQDDLVVLAAQTHTATQYRPVACRHARTPGTTGGVAPSHAAMCRLTNRNAPRRLAYACGSAAGYGVNRPPSSRRQSSSSIEMNPCALQAFVPAQELPLPPQSPVPLHLLTP